MQPFVPGQLLRIFVDRDDHWHGQPLYKAIVDMLRDEGVHGTSVFVGIAGYGSEHQHPHYAGIFHADDLPVLIEVIDDHESIERVLPHLSEMISEGAVTLERVDFVQRRAEPSAARDKRQRPSHVQRDGRALNERRRWRFWPLAHLLDS